MTHLPPNFRKSSNRFFASKLERLRDRTLRPGEVRTLVAELAHILAVEATETINPSEKIALIVILRSGLSMADAFLHQLSPEADVVVYHLGIYREKQTLEPVEYYNKLPRQDEYRHAVVVDPMIATGGTASAVVNILRDWGVSKITFASILASTSGIERAASLWPDKTQFMVGEVDSQLDAHGYTVPGLGDIGDRLFGTSLQ